MLRRVYPLSKAAFGAEPFARVAESNAGALFDLAVTLISAIMKFCVIAGADIE